MDHFHVGPLQLIHLANPCLYPPLHFGVTLSPIKSPLGFSDYAHSQNNLICFTFCADDSEVRISNLTQSLDIQALRAWRLAHRTKCLFYIDTEMFHWLLIFNTKNTVFPIKPTPHFGLSVSRKALPSPSYPNWRPGSLSQPTCPRLGKCGRWALSLFFCAMQHQKPRTTAAYINQG